MHDNSNSENVAQPDMDNFLDLTSYGNNNYVFMTSQTQTVDDIENRELLKEIVLDTCNGLPIKKKWNSTISRLLLWFVSAYTFGRR